jgi:hypothetical protein
MDFKLEKLPFVLIADITQIPKTSGIAFLIDDARRVWGVCVALTDASLRLEVKTSLLSDHELFTLTNVTKIAYFLWQDNEDLTQWYDEATVKYSFSTADELPICNLGYDYSQFINRYREIKQQIKFLEDELDELKPNIVSIIESEGGEIKNREYNARIQKRITFNYSNEIKELEKRLKELKKDEENNGIALIKNVSIFPVVKS